MHNSSSSVIASLRTEYSRNCVDFAHAPRLKAGSVCTSKIGLLKSIGDVMVCDNLVYCDNLNVIFVPDPFKFILNYSNSSEVISFNSKR